jgi:hypothetical protein
VPRARFRSGSCPASTQCLRTCWASRRVVHNSCKYRRSLGFWQARSTTQGGLVLIGFARRPRPGRFLNRAETPDSKAVEIHRSTLGRLAWSAARYGPRPYDPANRESVRVEPRSRLGPRSGQSVHQPLVGIATDRREWYWDQHVPLLVVLQGCSGIEVSAFARPCQPIRLGFGPPGRVRAALFGCHLAEPAATLSALQTTAMRILWIRSFSQGLRRPPPSSNRRPSVRWGREKGRAHAV